MGDNLHTILALPVIISANITLPSLKYILAAVKCGCLAWFCLLHPHSFLDTKGVLAVFGEGIVPRYQVLKLMLGVNIL